MKTQINLFYDNDKTEAVKKVIPIKGSSPVVPSSPLMGDLLESINPQYQKRTFVVWRGKNLYKFDEEDVREVGETETYVDVVLMGHCEWKNKREMDTKKLIMDSTNLTKVVPNPRSVAYSDLMEDEEVTKYFVNNRGGGR